MDAETGREGPSVGLEKEILPRMLKYTIETFYPEIHSNPRFDTDQKKYSEFFREVVLRTARLVAEWQCVGFCHGVLNTDNMSIVGVTIDYGPFGYIDSYNPEFICNGSDNGGRYSYRKQPEICKWNCKKLSESLEPVLPSDISKAILEEFDSEFKKHYNQKMRKKFGLFEELEDDEKIFSSFLDILHQTDSDFTNSFRNLNKIPVPSSKEELEKEDWFEKAIENFISLRTPIETALAKLKPRFPPQQLQKLIMIAQKEPAMLSLFGIDPNLIIQEIKNIEKLRAIESLSKDQKDERDRKLWKNWLTTFSLRLLKEKNLPPNRIEIMNKNNPRIVLRNYLAQNVIELAEKGDYSGVRNLLEALKRPFDEEEPYEGSGKEEQQVTEKYDSLPPTWSGDICVT